MADNWSINYNPDSSKGLFGDRDGGPETALIIEEWPHGKDGKFWQGPAYFILKGDFREDYARLPKPSTAFDMKRLYDEMKRKHGARWSTDFHEWGRDGKVRKSQAARERRKRKERAG
jgi:hypothetical protein